VGLFSRTRRPKRVQLGTYRNPEPRAAPSTESLVDEGLQIVESGVKLAVKNQSILWALRDGADFDHLQYLEATREQLLGAAAESAADADRVAAELADPHQEDPRYDSSGEPGRLERRLEVLLGLVARIHGLLDDESYLAGLALQARDAAWEEIGGAVKHAALHAGTKLDRPTGDDRDYAIAQVRLDLDEMEARARLEAYGG
jgi:hypothetical protein